MPTSDPPQADLAQTSLCQAIWLGTMGYPDASSLQLSLVDRVHAGEQPNTLLLLEHPHVYTKGRLSQAEHVLVAEPDLAAQGIPVHETDRGGLVTYHGPGQLVGYPIVNLRDWGGPVKYVRTLEQVIATSLQDLGVEAYAEEGCTGVWTESGKIAAIGVKISRGVAFHGFAVNVNTDLAYYANIIPCGITNRPVTSMAHILGQPADMAAVRRSIILNFGNAMGFRMEDSGSESLSAITLGEA